MQNVQKYDESEFMSLYQYSLNINFFMFIKVLVSRYVIIYFIDRTIAHEFTIPLILAKLALHLGWQLLKAVVQIIKA